MIKTLQFFPMLQKIQMMESIKTVMEVMRPVMGEGVITAEEAMDRKSVIIHVPMPTTTFAMTEEQEHPLMSVPLELTVEIADQGILVKNHVRRGIHRPIRITECVKMEDRTAAIVHAIEEQTA